MPTQARRHVVVSQKGMIMDGRLTSDEKRILRAGIRFTRMARDLDTEQERSQAAAHLQGFFNGLLMTLPPQKTARIMAASYRCAGLPTKTVRKVLDTARGDA